MEPFRKLGGDPGTPSPAMVAPPKPPVAPAKPCWGAEPGGPNPRAGGVPGLRENPAGTATRWHRLRRGHDPPGDSDTVAPAGEVTKTLPPPRSHRAPCSEPCGESPMARPSCPPPKEGTVTCAGALGTLYSASATSAARFSSTSWGHGSGVTERRWHCWVAPLGLVSPLSVTW